MFSLILSLTFVFILKEGRGLKTVHYAILLNQTLLIYTYILTIGKLPKTALLDNVSPQKNLSILMRPAPKFKKNDFSPPN